jgi:diacylglycerol O-acyltransferase
MALGTQRGALEPHGKRLTSLDALFLQLESPNTPMHSASVAIFEGEPLCDARGALRIEALSEEIERRHHLVPKLRMRVMVFGQLHPTWVDDTRFDMKNHLHTLALPDPGSDEQLLDVCADLISVPLDREHPLWEMWFLQGLEGGRVALVEKLHHALADGLAGVELATLLLDPTPNAARVREADGPWNPRPAPSMSRVLAREMTRRLSMLLRLTAFAGASALHPISSMARSIRLAHGLADVVSPRAVAPRSSLNRRVGPRRSVALISQPLEEMRRIERRFGVTLNDVVLSAVAGGVTDLYEARNELGSARQIQVLVPVGFSRRNPSVLGNNVSAMLARLPLARTGPVTRLRAVSREMTRCKQHHHALAGALLLRVLAELPASWLRATVPVLQRQPFVNVVVTNVPGTRSPLYAMGARMLQAFPIVPIAGNLTVGVAALSYDTELTIGLLADRDGCTDLEILARGIERAFSELSVAAGPVRRRGARSSHPVAASVGVAEDAAAEVGFALRAGGGHR